MKTIAIALLATGIIGTSAIAASNDQQPQTKQMQPQTNAQSQNKAQQNTQDQNNAKQHTAQNDQPIAPRKLPRRDVRQVQQALDKDGFKAGRPDGRWGPETANAMKQFQQSKQIGSNGQLDRQTLADLGLDASRFQRDEK